MSRNSPNPIFALDLGTTKFCLVALRPLPSGRWSVETVDIPAAGMRRGMVADLEDSRRAIGSLMETAENQLGCDITKVVVGVAGSHLASHVTTAGTTLESQRVGERDVRRLFSQAESQFTLEKRELLHTVALGYRLDHREDVDNPIGFYGRNLNGEFFQIHADQYYLKDLVRLCNDCGLQVERLYSEPFASASVTLNDEQKQMGVVLADIGGGTTDGIVFRKGRPRAAFTVNVAGKLMTNDLSVGLNIPFEDAEQLKIRFGLDTDAAPVFVKNVHGRVRSIGPAQINPILIPRIHELCTLLDQKLRPFKGALGAGILLTGGGAGVRGLDTFFQSHLDIPVGSTMPVWPLDREESCEQRSSSSRPMHPARHATALGLLNLELCRRRETFDSHKTSWASRYLGPFVNWLKELS